VTFSRGNVAHSYRFRVAARDARFNKSSPDEGCLFVTKVIRVGERGMTRAKSDGQWTMHDKRRL